MLVDEIIRQSRDRFVPKMGIIKKTLEGLIEKEYLVRSEENRDVYLYVS